MAVYLKWMGDRRCAPDAVWFRGLERRGDGVVAHWDVKDEAHDFVDRTEAERLRESWHPPEVREGMVVVEEESVSFDPLSRRTLVLASGARSRRVGA